MPQHFQSTPTKTKLIAGQDTLPNKRKKRCAQHNDAGQVPVDHKYSFAKSEAMDNENVCKL